MKKRTIDNKGIYLFGILVLIVDLSLIIFSYTGGIRGSDQWWYYADIQNIISGIYKTSKIWVGMFPLNATDIPNQPFIHNSISIYIAGMIGKLTNALYGWTAFNIICVFLETFIIYSCLKKYIVDHMAFIMSVIFVLIPDFFYLSTQMLRETWISLLMSIILLSLVDMFRNNKIGNLYLIALLLAVVCLENKGMLSIVLILPFVEYYYLKHNNKSILFIVSSSLLFLLMYFSLTSLFFKEYGNWLDISGSTFMRAFFDNAYGDNTKLLYVLNDNKSEYLDYSIIQLFMKKLWSAVKVQLFPLNIKELVFRGIFNILCVINMYGLFSKKYKVNNYLFLLSLVGIISYSAICVIFQNQYRYSVIILPFLFVGGAIVIDDVYNSIKDKKIRISMVVFCIIAFLCINISSGYYSRKEALLQNKQVSEVCDFTKGISDNKSIMLISSKLYTMIDEYALRNHKLYLTRCNNSDEKDGVITSIKNYCPNYILLISNVNEKNVTIDFDSLGYKKLRVKSINDRRYIILCKSS